MPGKQRLLFYFRHPIGFSWRSCRGNLLNSWGFLFQVLEDSLCLDVNSRSSVILQEYGWRRSLQITLWSSMIQPQDTSKKSKCLTHLHNGWLPGLFFMTMNRLSRMWRNLHQNPLFLICSMLKPSLDLLLTFLKITLVQYWKAQVSSENRTRPLF